MMRESGPESGSVCLSRRSDRHGFPKNRHSYFTNPSICPRIGRIKLAACPEKAAFGTVWTEDNTQNGLQPVVIRKNSCFSSKSGVRHYRQPIPLRKNYGFSWKFGIRPDRRTLSYKKVGFLDRSPIRICPEGHGEPRESGYFTGSVCLSRRSDRHGFLKNRHGYFTNPSICPRIGRIKLAACPEKAAFSTVWTEDNSQNGLQYAGRKDTGDWGQIPIRMEREFRGPGYRAGRKNDEQDNPMENQV